MDRREGRRGEPRRSGPRVPPHNLQAEESVLGALLLSRDAIGAVSEQGLRPDDFYKPGHQHIFDAVRALYSTGAPADTITVADELRRAGLLDQVGGVEALHALQNATPAISNAAHYARIVQDTALLRRLIHVAADIAELAYGEPDDVTKAVDEAESKVFKVAEERVTDSTQLLSESIKGVMDRLEETFARGDTITGTATGYHDVDELLSGLQASSLNIVGARPAMGKCVAWHTPMADAVTGELVTALELFERSVARGSLTIRALGRDGAQQDAEVGACLDDGDKPVFTVRTRSGRSVTITATHPLLTARGWTPLEDVAVGDVIAVPTNVPVFGTTDRTDGEIAAMAWSVAGASGQSAHDDRSPQARLRSAVFALPRPRLARFLNRLFALGATVGTAVRGQPSIALTATGERAAHDVAHALVRFGVLADVRGRCVTVVDPRSLVRFADEIGIAGRDSEMARLRTEADAADSDAADDLPAEAWVDVLKAVERTWKDIEDRRGRLRRSTVARLAEALDDDQLRWWASPDVAWDPIVEISPAGTMRVVDFTVPDLHNFVAADVYLHNTAFGLGIATHVAQTTGRPVLVFSLEMSHNELTQRILSSEAKVDSTKMRNGRLSESDWAKIGRAIGRLEVPLFLDDNPRVTVMEIRAKARRLKARHGGLALIVIDYLQLMTGGGNSENRQLEVSEISRNLKILARELEVPIVALSQLSRNLESRGDKRPMLSDLRESGCLTADTRLVRADTNGEVTLGELVTAGAVDLPVWSLDADRRLVPARLIRAFPSGVKDVVRLRLASGRTIEASTNHRFLTAGGWQPVADLDVDVLVATAARIPMPPHRPPPTMDGAELVLLGHLIGDGRGVARHDFAHTVADSADVMAVVEAARAFGVTARVHRDPASSLVHLPSPFRLTPGRRHPIAQWLRQLGATRRRSSEQFVPAAVFEQPIEQVAVFVRHLWATDGRVVVDERRAPRVYYRTSSAQLAEDVSALLLRLDIRSRLMVGDLPNGRSDVHVVVAGGVNQLRFADVVGGPGAQAIRRVRSVPRPLVAATRTSGVRIFGSSGEPGPPSSLDSDTDLAGADIAWDRVVAITPIGQRPVFDATVEGTHNFVANGIIAHNSLEQDADVVMFLYRDEVYNAESTEKGAAEVIVAKHRSGPIGTKRLVFLGQYTRFDNAARGV